MEKNERKVEKRDKREVLAQVKTKRNPFGMRDKNK